MKWLTLGQIKQQVRIEQDFDDENSLLTSYGAAAEETVANLLNRGKTVDDMVASLTDEYGGIPESITNAALMLVDNWYQHRSPIDVVNMSVVPYAFDLIIKPYMVL